MAEEKSKKKEKKSKAAAKKAKEAADKKKKQAEAAHKKETSAKERQKKSELAAKAAQARRAEANQKAQAAEGRQKESSSKERSSKSHKKCFPGKATVNTPTGVRQMSDLKVGDCVQSKLSDGSTVLCDRIYMFGHAEGSTAMYHQLHLTSGKTIALSAAHFIHTARFPQTPFAESELKYGRDVKVGDWIWERNGMSQVTHKTVQNLAGVYNPYTESGNIIVDGVVASAHSEWFLDAVVPVSMLPYLPAIYQGVLGFNRLLFWITGPRSAEFFGLANPASSADFWISNWFFIFSWFSAFSVLLVTLLVRLPSRIGKRFTVAQDYKQN